MKTKILGIFCVLSFAISCSVEQDDKLIHLVETSNQYKDSVWMEQEDRLTSGEWYKVLLVFGWIDDETECKRIIENYKKTYPEINYRCNPVK